MLTRRCLAATVVVVALASGLSWAASPAPGATGASPAYVPDSVVPFGHTPVGANAVSDPNAPIVGMATTHDAFGYWLVGSDGGVFSYGDARFFGSAGALHLNAPIVGMAATGDGGGYWLVARDGGIFSYGDALFWGSTGGTRLNAPVVGMAALPSRSGYWLVAADGGIFAYGDAPFYGSAGAVHLNRPVVGLAATPDDHGYWLVASDGGVFTYGNATYFGSLGGTALPAAVVGMAAGPPGGGYWLVLGSGLLAGRVVGIDPGHNGGNGSDPGFIDQPVSNGTGSELCDTTGTETAGGYTEAQFNFDVATDLEADLQGEGATVVMTRTDNDGVGPCVTTRAAIINDAAADVAVDIHADGGPPGGSGFDVSEPVADGPNDGVIASSDSFAAVLRDAFVAGTGMPVADYGGAVDGLVPRNDLAGLNLTTVPKALIEIGNMANADDAALEVSPSFRQAAAQAIADAITQYLSGPS